MADTPSMESAPSALAGGLYGSVEVAPDIRIARPSRNRAFAIAVLVWSAGWAAMILVVPNLGGLRFADYLALGLFFFGPAAIGLLLAHRVYASGLWIGAGGVVVRGPLHTWKVPLAEADSFAGGVQPGMGNGTPCPLLLTRDGGKIGIWTLGREGLIFHYGRYLEELEPLCEELNGLLSTVRGR